MNDVTLEAPGKGLPPLEAFVARYLLFPLKTRLTSRPEAIRLLEEKGRQALTLAQALSPDDLTRPVLIDRFPGIEDSSRHWSVLMTIRHLLITGESMADLVTCLVSGEAYERMIRIEDVKPEQSLDAQAVFAEYEAFLLGYADRMTPLLTGDFTRRRHEHPWFGPITAHEWLCLNALHHGIHLNQIHRIAARL